MSGRHTPGPWHVTSGRFIYNEAGWAVGDALIYHGKFKEGEYQANARLMAAAPVLLKAAQNLLERYLIMGCGEGPEALFAKWAIAKATQPPAPGSAGPPAIAPEQSDGQGEGGR